MKTNNILKASCLALMSATALTGCSKADNSDVLPKGTVAVGNYTFKMPNGYHTYAQNQNEIALTNKNNEVIFVQLASSKENINLQNWCNESKSKLSQNYKKNAQFKILNTKRNGSQTCEVQSHGEPTYAGKTTAEKAKLPKYMSISGSMTKLKNNDYLTIKSNHENNTDSFATENTIRNTLIDDVK